MSRRNRQKREKQITNRLVRGSLMEKAGRLLAASESAANKMLSTAGAQMQEEFLTHKVTPVKDGEAR